MNLLAVFYTAQTCSRIYKIFSNFKNQLKNKPNWVFQLDFLVGMVNPTINLQAEGKKKIQIHV